MSDQLLTILKFFLVALVWLFFLRVLRAVWVELRTSDEPAAPPVAAPPPAPAAARRSGALARKAPSRLRVVEPDDMKGRVFDLAEEQTVGRSSRCDITLDGDTYASSTHARLYFNDGRLWIEDLNSTNGTFVNSARTDSPTTLKRGDLLQIGRTVFEVAA